MTTARTLRVRLVPAVAGLALLAPAGASATPADPPSTRCVVEGPVPGHRVLRLELPQGSDYLTLELRGSRPVRPASDEAGWHLAQGVVVVDAATLQPVAHHVVNTGTAPPVVTVERDGQTVARQGVVAPDGPFTHASRQSVTGLPPGTYYAVMFGAGGPTTGARAQTWGASVHVAGTHGCHPPTDGEVFDLDHTEFRGGTQVHVPGAGYAEGVSATLTTGRPLVVGFVDAATQARETGEISVAYDTPLGAGTLARGVTPFVSTAGRHRWTASYRGAYPVVSVSGVAVSLPAADSTP